jgi:predicted secreted protein
VIEPARQQQLQRIERLLFLDDPHFADGMRTGSPCSPREYRRRRRLLVATALVAVLAGLMCALLWGAAYAIPVVVLTAPTMLVLSVVTAPRG